MQVDRRRMLARPRRSTQSLQTRPPPLLNHALPFSPQPASSLHGRQSKSLAAQRRKTEDRDARRDVKQADRQGAADRSGGRDPAQSGKPAVPQAGDASGRPWPQVRLKNVTSLCCWRPHSSERAAAHEVDVAMMTAKLRTAGGPAPESVVAEAKGRGVATSARCCLRRRALSARQGL